VQAQFIEMVWQSKHHVEVGNIEQFFFSFLYPFLPLMPLTLWAMTIPTAIVAEV